MSDKVRDGLARGFGFRNASEMRLHLRGGQPGTRATILEDARAAHRAIRDVTVDDEPGHVTVHVRLRWWAWLGLGLVHRQVRQRLQAVERKHRPAGAGWAIRVR